MIIEIEFWKHELARLSLQFNQSAQHWEAPANVWQLAQGVGWTWLARGKQGLFMDEQQFIKVFWLVAGKDNRICYI